MNLSAKTRIKMWGIWLENKELTDVEYKFIRNFGQNISPMLENVDIKSQMSTMVADVYTDQEGQVLEEGTGKLELIGRL